MDKSVADTIAGGFGGLACVAVGQPLDTVKVKLQAFPNLYPTLLSTIRKTFREEGLRGFYAGCAPACLSNVAENAVLFVAYGNCQKLVQWVTGKSDNNMSVLERASAGALASLFSSVAITPPDLIKSRLQAQRALLERAGVVTTKRETTWSVIKSIMRTDGLTGFFRGLTSTWVREASGYFFFFGGYNASRTLLTPPGKKSTDNLGIWRTAAAGGIAGCCFWIAVFPSDVVRGELSGAFWVTLLQIFKTEGLLSCYRGLSPALIRAFPANAALFIVYEHTKELLCRTLVMDPA
ncbi:hypothetical protein EMCRGX_G033259 [Ephydatia muelleri]